MNAGEVPSATAFRSSMPIELVGNEGVMKHVSAGHSANDAPIIKRSRMTKFSIPACVSATPTPTPAAPPPTTTTS